MWPATSKANRGTSDATCWHRTSVLSVSWRETAGWEKGRETSRRVGWIPKLLVYYIATITTAEAATRFPWIGAATVRTISHTHTLTHKIVVPSHDHRHVVDFVIVMFRWRCNGGRRRELDGDRTRKEWVDRDFHFYSLAAFCVVRLNLLFPYFR